MSDQQALERECRLITRYLIGGEPQPAIADAYRSYHNRFPDQVRPTSRFDELSVALARSGSLGLRLADGYTGLFRRQGALRQKIVLTLALLESSAPSHHVIDRPYRGIRLLVLTKLALRTAGELAILALAVPIMMPLQLLLGRSKPGSGSG